MRLGRQVKMVDRFRRIWREFAFEARRVFEAAYVTGTAAVGALALSPQWGVVL